MANDISGIRDAIAGRARIADQMLSAHAVLRDRFSHRALLIDLVVFALATALCVMTFADDRLLASVGLHGAAGSILLGAASTMVFFLSIAQLRLDWKQKSSLHGQACRVLASIKTKCRDIERATETLEATGSAFLETSGFMMATLPSIPEEDFIALKAHHRFKVEVSKHLDAHPAVPPWAIRLWLRGKAVRSLLSRAPSD